MPNTTVPTITAALEAANRLAELRREQCDNVADLTRVERDFAYEKALGEKAIIDAAGGEANLGKNEAARERAFALGLCDNPHYRQAREAHADAEAERRLLDVDVKLASDRLNILLAALNAGILDVDATLLTDAVADQPADQFLWPAHVIVAEVSPAHGTLVTEGDANVIGDHA